MSLASNSLGQSVLFCAIAEVDLVIATASTVIAAERSRSRFVSIVTIPSGSQLVIKQVWVAGKCQASCAMVG
jgi:hypothetical protein